MFNFSNTLGTLSSTIKQRLNLQIDGIDLSTDTPKSLLLGISIKQLNRAHC
jgi:hypothetical protein